MTKQQSYTKLSKMTKQQSYKKLSNNVKTIELHEIK